ncbi:type III-B CRISPR-associated protein Cas10/Cmr2 [Acidilobus sp.]|uniref:type III-B CRISPR-associated protein Cas10/Cmr2 n=1 Tax=Acidilobus sp. TaxID=1872109 RepID=UPI003D059EF9
MQAGDLLDLKLMAYFHDPPWKAWVVSKSPSTPLLSDKGGHEDDSKELLSMMGVPVQGNFPPIEVSMADRLVSSFDRWVASLLSLLLKDRNVTVPVEIKKNLFAPWYKVDVRNFIDKDSVRNYAEKLSSLVKKAEKNLRYHVAYYLAPLLWYEHFPCTPGEPCAVPVADTRAPTHTIFDHATATAAMLNILRCNNNVPEFYGSVAMIDFPSIQEFISFSRKTSDLWASSWLTSLLLWKSVEPFVERYGPDVVLRPELSLNHFFISWLANKVKDRDLKEMIIELGKKYAGLQDDGPMTSMMGDKVVLLLPEPPDDVKKELQDNFNKAWNLVASEAFKDAGIEGLLNGDLRDYLERAKKTPPVRPRIVAVDLKEAFGKYYNAIKGLVKEKLSCSGWVSVEYSLFFEYLLSRVNSEESKIKVKYTYGVGLADAVATVTSSGDYQLCTMCGLLPAVVSYVSQLTGAGFRKLRDVKKGEEEEDKLCPYCALKRSLNNGDVVTNVLKAAGLLPEGTGRREFPSTSEIAMKDLDRLLRPYIGDKNIKGPYLAELYEKCYGGSSEACDTVYNLVKDRAGNNIKDEKALKDFIKKHGDTYFAIIKADGDFMGKGYWRGLLRNSDGKCTSLEGYIRAAVTIPMPDSDKELLDVLSYEVKSITDVREALANSDEDYKKLIEGVEETLKREPPCTYSASGGGDLAVSNYMIPITPAYAYTLSRALTAQAALDIKALNEAEASAVYVGGDDLLAFSPIRFNGRLVPLDVVESTRKTYWGFSENSIKGFKCLGGGNNCMPVDAMANYGRSYVVLLAHYKDPLPMSFNTASEMLEEKDHVKDKDVLFIYSGRGVASSLQWLVSTLKLSDKGELDLQPLNAVRDIYNAISSKRVSTSFIYDYFSIRNYMELAVNNGPAKEAYRALALEVAERNKAGKSDISAVKDYVARLASVPSCESTKNDSFACKGDRLYNVALAVNHLR